MTTHCSSNSGGHDNRYYIKSQVDNKIKKPEMGISIVGTDSFIMYPEDGNYHSTTTRETGYLKITFPVSWTRTILSFQVTIYDYTINASATYHISGYTYGTGWYNVSAVCIGTYGRSLCNIPVRFGHDGSKCAVTIGEASTVWQYPQVQVHNIMTGYQSYGYNTWKTGWNVQITTTALPTINHTITNPHVANGVSIPWNSITNKPTSYTPAAHSHYTVNMTDKRNTLYPSVHPPFAVSFYFGSKTGMNSTTTNPTDYSDIMVLKGWNDTSGGAVNALVFNKCTQEILHYQGDFNASTWKNIKKLAYTDHTHSYLPLSGGNISGLVTMGTNCALQWLNSGGPLIGSFATTDGYQFYLSPTGWGSAGITDAIYIGYGNSNGDLNIWPRTDNRYSFGLSYKRWKQICAATSTIVTSDRNLKKDEKDFEDEFVSKLIMGLKPKTYKFKQNDSNRTHYGFIAQDIEDLLPELGITSKDIAAFIKTPNTRITGSEENPISEEEIIPEGEDGYGFTYSLRYEELISPLVRKVQMQQKEIGELKETVTQLQQAITPHIAQ